GVPCVEEAIGAVVQEDVGEVKRVRNALAMLLRRLRVSLHELPGSVLARIVQLLDEPGSALLLVAHDTDQGERVPVHAPQQVYLHPMPDRIEDERTALAVGDDRTAVELLDPLLLGSDDPDLRDQRPGHGRVVACAAQLVPEILERGDRRDVARSGRWY